MTPNRAKTGTENPIDDRDVLQPIRTDRANASKLIPLRPLDLTGTPKQNIALAMIGALSTIVVIGIWWILTGQNGPIPDLYFASPPEVIQAAITYMSEPYQGSTVLGHAISSLKTVLLGWIVAALIGIPFGVWVGWSRVARWTVYPVFQVIRPIPPIAWIPLALMWFGIGEQSRVFVVFLSAFVPWAINSMQAVDSTDTKLIQAASVFGATESYTLRRVILKTGIPTILAAGQIAMGNAWTTVVAAELLGAYSGLGYMALTSSRTLDIDILVMAMLLLGLIGALLSTLMKYLTRVLAPRGVRL